jgi:hypothetical protein
MSKFFLIRWLDSQNSLVLQIGQVAQIAQLTQTAANSQTAAISQIATISQIAPLAAFGGGLRRLCGLHTAQKQTRLGISDLTNFLKIDYNVVCKIF